MIRLHDLQLDKKSIMTSSYEYALIDSASPYIKLGQSDYAEFVKSLNETDLDCSGEVCSKKAGSCD